MRTILLSLSVLFSTNSIYALSPQFYENVHRIAGFGEECSDLAIKNPMTIVCADASHKNDSEELATIVAATYRSLRLSKMKHLRDASFPGFLRVCDHYSENSKAFTRFCARLQTGVERIDQEKFRVLQNMHFVASYPQRAGAHTVIKVNSQGRFKLRKFTKIFSKKPDSEKICTVLNQTFDIKNIERLDLSRAAKTSMLGLDKIVDDYTYSFEAISACAKEIKAKLDGAFTREHFPWRDMMAAANAVYYYQEDQKKEIPGFKTDMGYYSDGFAAASFIDPEGKKAIVAFRGTIFENKKPWYLSPNLHVDTAIGLQNRHRSLQSLPLLSAVGAMILAVPLGIVGLVSGVIIDAIFKSKQWKVSAPFKLSLGLGLTGIGAVLGGSVPSAIVYSLYTQHGHKRFSSYLSYSGNFVSKVVLDLKRRYRGKRFKVYVTGHSLGGYLAQHAALVHNLDGVAFSSPSIEVHDFRYMRQHYHGEFYNFLFDRDYVSLLFMKGALGAVLLHDHKKFNPTGTLMDFHKLSSIIDYFSRVPLVDFFAGIKTS